MSFMRLYQGFSFLVSMLEAVFFDLKYFIAFYSFVVFIYAVIFTVILTSTTGGAMQMEEY